MVRVYSYEEIKQLHNMSNQEVIETLKETKNEFLPINYILEPKEGRLYSESHYNDTRLQIAMEKAIELLENSLKD
jgi:hypothetical protein